MPHHPDTPVVDTYYSYSAPDSYYDGYYELDYETSTYDKFSEEFTIYGLPEKYTID